MCGARRAGDGGCHVTHPTLHDDAIENMILTVEILSFLRSHLVIIPLFESGSFSSAKMDAAIKIKGFIFLEFANSLRSRRDRSFNVRRRHPK